jgi:hypothetical protein
MHCRHCGCAMTAYEAAELASQADRCALTAPFEECGIVWYCDSCYPALVEVATNALKRRKEVGENSQNHMDPKGGRTFSSLR